MKVHSIDSELWWIANADEIRSPRSFPLRESLQIIQEIFGFFALPTTIPTGTDGFVFQQGRLIGADNDVVVIRQMVIYNGGVHISVAGPTDGADKVFDRVVELFQSWGVRQPSTPPVKFYRSFVTCDFDKSIAAVFAKYQSIIGALQGKSCVPDAKIYETGIAFSADPTTLPANVASYNPTLFTMNRKTDVAFSTNRYTCFANMTTNDHLAALTEIENLL